MTTYKKTGVDVDKAESLVRGLKEKFPSLGGYAGVFPFGEHKLAATCDGVGTKIKLAVEFDMHEVVGEDLVAMSINDLIAGGAQPLFFLDYFSCGKLNEDVFNRIMTGIESGIKKAGCILLGGETAEMPDMYGEKDYDLAGFACGVIIKEFRKEEIRKGDIIIGLNSSGIHSNGFSLVRNIFNEDELEKYKDLILKPTEIYSNFTATDEGRKLMASYIKSMAHVTGGGINRAMKRLLGEGVGGEIFPFESQGVFKIIQEKGVDKNEMENVFNMGLGMVLVTEEKDKEKVLSTVGGSVVGKVV